MDSKAFNNIDLHKKYSNVRVSLEEFFIYFKKHQKEISFLITQKGKKVEKNLFQAYFDFLQRYENGYRDYLKNKKISDHINRLFVKIEIHFMNYIRNYEQLRIYFLEVAEDHFDKNSMNIIFKNIDNLNICLEKILVKNFNDDFNIYLIELKNIENILSKIKKKLSTLENIIYSESKYKKKIDYSKLRLLSLDELKTGDIVLFDKPEEGLKSIYRKGIKLFLKTSIIHSSLFIKKEGNKYLLFEADGYNDKKTKIIFFTPETNYKYIVLRLKEKLTKKEQTHIINNIHKYVGIRFSSVEIWIIGINMILKKLLFWFPFISQPSKGFFHIRRVVCSNIVTQIYNELGHNISNKIDKSSTTPTDILNSGKLEIIGYIKK